jgi:hypothetical protein
MTTMSPCMWAWYMPTAEADESGSLPAGMRYEHGKVVPTDGGERVARGREARVLDTPVESRGFQRQRGPPRSG